MAQGNIRRWLRERKWPSAAFLVVATALIFGVVWSPQIVGTSASQRLLPVYSVEREGKTVSLTFDAAWGNEDTQQLLDILDRYGVKATFFVVGEWVDKYPESVKALHDAGHEVMSHSDTHPHMASLSAEEISREVSASADKIQSVTGERPDLFRCPYGEYNDNVIATVRTMSMTPIQWSTDSLDWKGISAEEIVRRVENKVSAGDIILFHNAAEHTPEALPTIIEYLQKEGYTILPVGDLLLSGETSVDHTGRQMSKAEA